MGPSKIKAIVFDYDGVIELRHKGLLPAILQLLDVSVDKFRSVYYLHNRSTNVENKPWIDVVVLVAEKLGASIETVNKIKELSTENNKTIELNRELLDYIKNHIKPVGYLTAILSNNTTDLRDRINAMGIIDLFDEIIISAEVGYQKPEVEIFKILFDKLNVAPHEVVFADDNSRSLETSKELGYTPILYRNFVQYKEELERILAN